MTRKQFKEWVEKKCQMADTEEEQGKIEIIVRGHRVIVVDLETAKTGMSVSDAMSYDEDTGIAIAYASLRGEEVPEVEEEHEPEFKRVERNGKYYRVELDYGVRVVSDIDICNALDNSAAKISNYFLTRERAEEAADKIRTLFLLEKMHDIYCPDYKPDFNDSHTYKWCVREMAGEYKASWEYSVSHPTDVYFATREIAIKAADILNRREKEEM